MAKNKRNSIDGPRFKSEERPEKTEQVEEGPIKVPVKQDLSKYIAKSSFNLGTKTDGSPRHSYLKGDEVISDGKTAKILKNKNLI